MWQRCRRSVCSCLMNTHTLIDQRSDGKGALDTFLNSFCTCTKHVARLLFDQISKLWSNLGKLCAGWPGVRPAVSHVLWGRVCLSRDPWKTRRSFYSSNGPNGTKEPERSSPSSDRQQAAVDLSTTKRYLLEMCKFLCRHFTLLLLLSLVTNTNVK